MNYTLTFTKIKSNWFDHYEAKRGKKNTYDKIGGYKGLFLYLTLYKFRIHNQENYDTFISSIGLLRKETGYSTEEIFELLKLMKRANVIKISNCSRWDYLIDENGKIRDKDVLVIEATDIPVTVRKEKTDRHGEIILDAEGKPSMIDSPATDDDMYIGVSFSMLNKYSQLLTKKNKGLDKYIALYCLINKWNNNIEGKAFMSIENMANIIGVDKDYLHKMVINMNKNYLMHSTKRRRKSGKGYHFEHYIANSEKEIKNTEANYGEKIKKWVTKLEKKNASKNETNLEDSLPVSGVYDDTKKDEKIEPLAFNTKKSKVMGESDPFSNVSKRHIGYEVNQQELDEIEKLIL